MFLKPFPSPIPLAAAAFFLAGPALADGNDLYLLQDSTLGGGLGNTIFVDQTAASDSLLAGGVGTEIAPAQQIGGGNEAFVSLTGSDVSAFLLQGLSTSPAFGNTATMTIDGSQSLGAVTQIGEFNDALLSVSGSGSTGFVSQIGDSNAAGLSVVGTNSDGSVTQIGNQNDTGLLVEGNNMSVSYTLIGNGSSGVLPPSVRGDGTSVQIVQFVGF